MSDPVKVTALTAYTTPLLTDVIYVVADPGGTPTSKKTVLSDLAQNMGPILVKGTTPAIETAAGQTNTGFLGVKGKTSGELKITVADALAQTMTVTALAQTVGAAALSIPDFAGVADTFVFTTLAQTLSNKTLAAPTLSTSLTATPGGSTAAAGTTTADAGVLPAATSTVYPTTAADGTKGVRVHANDKVTGRMLFIGNGVSNQILKVYAPSGGTINGAAADAAFSSASGKGVVIVCLSSASNTWLAF